MNTSPFCMISSLASSLTSHNYFFFSTYNNITSSCLFSGLIILILPGVGLWSPFYILYMANYPTLRWFFQNYTRITLKKVLFSLVDCPLKKELFLRLPLPFALLLLAFGGDVEEAAPLGRRVVEVVFAATTNTRHVNMKNKVVATVCFIFFIFFIPTKY